MEGVFIIPGLRVLLLMVAVIFGGYIFVKLIKGIFWLFAGLFTGIGKLFERLFNFFKGMIGDGLRFAGHVVTALFYVPAIAFNIIRGHWSAANHYGRAIESECVGCTGCLYRLAVGHVATLLGLTPLTEGIERRVPEVMARAPGADRPTAGPNSFPGYDVVGSIPGGGSGAKLYLADMSEAKRRELSKNGREAPTRVVIKSFSLESGSTLPQIVRENRALAAARDLGIVLEHELGPRHFHYVMPYVPGDDLGTQTARMHGASGAAGLNDRQLSHAMVYAEDMLSTLHRFHASGLWHKDVKPSNIIVSDGRVHLVDFGLITPLRSAMTLTTHGTEYFRDPEMVRLALRGVKVHEVDGVKFDVYGAGAVLYSMIENSFPAHGSLSQIGKRCPEALRFIVRRAMADMDGRYTSANEMLADVRTVSSASDPFKVKPADLPSMAGRPELVEGLAAAQAEPPRSGKPYAAVGFGIGAVREVLSHLDKEDGKDKKVAVRSGAARFGRVAAGILVVLMLTGGLAVAFTAGSTGDWDPPYSGRLSSDSLSLNMEPAAQAGAAKLAQSMQVLPPVSLDRLPAPAANPGTVTTIGTVLVLDDLDADQGEPLAAGMAVLCSRLRAAHYAVIGDLSDSALVGEEDIELLAGARAAIGLSDPGDDNAVARLSDFLRDQDDSLDAILWVGQVGAGEPVRSRAVTRDEAVALELTSLLNG
jgi:serine/threonine protein kinase